MAQLGLYAATTLLLGLQSVKAQRQSLTQSAVKIQASLDLQVESSKATKILAVSMHVDQKPQRSRSPDQHSIVRTAMACVVKLLPQETVYKIAAISCNMRRPLRRAHLLFKAMSMTETLLQTNLQVLHLGVVCQMRLK